jgi:hypothetical protein
LSGHCTFYRASGAVASSGCKAASQRDFRCDFDIAEVFDTEHTPALQTATVTRLIVFKYAGNRRGTQRETGSSILGLVWSPTWTSPEIASCEAARMLPGAQRSKFATGAIILNVIDRRVAVRRREIHRRIYQA